MPVHLMHPLSRRPIVKLIDAHARSAPPGPAMPGPAVSSIAARQPDPVIEQAKHDLDAGMVDTDLHATSGLDAQRRATMVPGPGGTPPSL